jgi:hypothetical protein
MPVVITSFIARIVKDLARLASDISMPDSTHNVGRLLAIMYFWDIVRKHADKQYEQMREHLKAEGLITDSLEPGEHVMCESPKFVCSAKVTVPVKRFNAEELGKLLRKSKYKIPEFATREYVEKARIPSKSSVSYVISERQ